MSAAFVHQQQGAAREKRGVVLGEAARQRSCRPQTSDPSGAELPCHTAALLEPRQHLRGGRGRRTPCQRPHMCSTDWRTCMGTAAAVIGTAAAGLIMPVHRGVDCRDQASPAPVARGTCQNVLHVTGCFRENRLVCTAALPMHGGTTLAVTKNSLAQSPAQV